MLRFKEEEMIKKIKIVLAYREKKEPNVHGETCYTGYVSLNGHRVRFWNLPWKSVLDCFTDNVKWYREQLLEPEKENGK